MGARRRRAHLASAARRSFGKGAARALYSCGRVDLSEDRRTRASVAVAQCERSGGSSRGASVRRVECRVLTCDPGGRIASRVPPRPRIVAATRGDRGAPVRKRNILGQFRNPALWRSGSREPRLHARALGGSRRELTPWETTHSRDLRAQIHPGEAYRTVAPKRARSLTSGGAPGRRGRARGRAENTERREICREPVGSETRRAPQKNPKLASSRQSRSRARALPSRPYAAVSTQAGDLLPRPLRALLK